MSASTSTELQQTLYEYVAQFHSLPSADILRKRANCRYVDARKFILNAQRESTFTIDSILASQSTPPTVTTVMADVNDTVEGKDESDPEYNLKKKSRRKPSGNLLIDAVVQITEEMVPNTSTEPSQWNEVDSLAITLQPITTSAIVVSDSVHSQLVMFGYNLDEIQNAIQSIHSEDINDIIAHIDGQREITANHKVLETAWNTESNEVASINDDGKEMESESIESEDQNEINRIDCYQLFNKQQNTVCSVTIDARSTEEYEHCHLRNALHIDDGLSTEQIGSAMKDHIESTGKGSITEVFMYSNNESSSKNIDRISHALRQRINGRSLCPDIDPIVCVLDSNFSVFSSLFPFLCRSGTSQQNQLTLSTMTPGRRRKVIREMNCGNYPNQIINDTLYLGDRKSALTEQVLVDLKITHIVNATNAPPAEYPRDYTSKGFIKNKFEDRKDLNVKYIRVPVDDISVQKIKDHFDAVHQLIHDAIHKERGRVLVHCFAGVSRSSTIVISYLMRYRKMSYLEAFQLVKSRRDVIQPNVGFVDQLKAFESELAADCECKEEEIQIVGLY